jgi:hypothetical protein
MPAKPKIDIVYAFQAVPCQASGPPPPRIDWNLVECLRNPPIEPPVKGAVGFDNLIKVDCFFDKPSQFCPSFGWVSFIVQYYGNISLFYHLECAMDGDNQYHLCDKQINSPAFSSYRNHNQLYTGPQKYWNVLNNEGEPNSHLFSVRATDIYGQKSSPRDWAWYTTYEDTGSTQQNFIIHKKTPSQQRSDNNTIAGGEIVGSPPTQKPSALYSNLSQLGIATPFACVPTNKQIGNVSRFWVVACAGADQTVTSGDFVRLEGIGTNNLDATMQPSPSPAPYSWQQTSGHSVSLSNDGTANPTFVAPSVKNPTNLKF